MAYEKAVAECQSHNASLATADSHSALFALKAIVSAQFESKVHNNYPFEERLWAHRLSKNGTNCEPETINGSQWYYLSVNFLGNHVEAEGNKLFSFSTKWKETNTNNKLKFICVEGRYQNLSQCCILEKRRKKMTKKYLFSLPSKMSKNLGIVKEFGPMNFFKNSALFSLVVSLSLSYTLLVAFPPHHILFCHAPYLVCCAPICSVLNLLSRPLFCCALFFAILCGASQIYRSMT